MVPHSSPISGVRVVGRYALYDEIAAGGMATVHIGRLLGPVGFSRTVAIKRLHAQFAKDPDFVSMFLDEARLAARVRHPNVIGTLDVVALSGELFLVMEYVPGESLAKLWRTTREMGRFIPVPIVVSILVGILEGLHAAHEATNDRGEALGLVHRDVSPHNVLVGLDGIARVLDFGVAKASGRLQTTRDGQLKGKISYMAPEQVQGVVDRTSDIYSASVVLWEALVGRRLFFAENDARTLSNVLFPKVEPPSRAGAKVPPSLDAVVMRALDREPSRRYRTAREMARALQDAVPGAPAFVVGEWVEATAGVTLARRASRLASIERMLLPDSDHPPPMSRPSTPPSVSSISLRRAPAGLDVLFPSGQPGLAGEGTIDSSAPMSLERPKRRTSTTVVVASLAVALAALLVVTIARLSPEPRGVPLPAAEPAAHGSPPVARRLLGNGPAGSPGGGVEAPGRTLAPDPHLPRASAVTPTSTSPVASPPVASPPAAPLASVRRAGPLVDAVPVPNAGAAPVRSAPQRAAARPVATVPVSADDELDHVIDSRK
ncbi:MAG TPA: protein kinase [Polyangiaceae bacterium]|nr:protein kinase [Polyangiaceae bacterium]